MPAQVEIPAAASISGENCRGQHFVNIVVLYETTRVCLYVFRHITHLLHIFIYMLGMDVCMYYVYDIIVRGIRTKVEH